MTKTIATTQRQQRSTSSAQAQVPILEAELELEAEAEAALRTPARAPARVPVVEGGRLLKIQPAAGVAAPRTRGPRAQREAAVEAGALRRAQGLRAEGAEEVVEEEV